MTRRHTSLLVTVLVALVGALLLAGCGSSGGGSVQATGAPAADTIVIKNFMFQPATLTVAPGARVTVHNEDTATHTLTATGAKAFDSGDVAGGATKTFTAPAKSGSYTYICSVHNYMQGTLVVR